jgi:uncharacterized protein (TIGR03083 family)
VADEGDLRGLDPFDPLDREAERLDRFFAALDDSRWDDPSRCGGWTVRDVLAHLAATENYHHACLDDALSAFVQDGLDAGASDLDGFNAWGLRAYEGRDPATILDEWRAANARTRRGRRGPPPARPPACSRPPHDLVDRVTAAALSGTERRYGGMASP